VVRTEAGSHGWVHDVVEVADVDLVAEVAVGHDGPGAGRVTPVTFRLWT
jgi:hypothetical protein